jgi:hypothetical protein
MNYRGGKEMKAEKKKPELRQISKGSRLKVWGANGKHHECIDATVETINKDGIVRWQYLSSDKDKISDSELHLTCFSVQWNRALWWRGDGGGESKEGEYREGFVLVKKNSAAGSMTHETRKLGVRLLQLARRKLCYRAIMIWKESNSWSDPKKQLTLTRLLLLLVLLLLHWV